MERVTTFVLLVLVPRSYQSKTVVDRARSIRSSENTPAVLCRQVILKHNLKLLRDIDVMNGNVSHHMNM